MRHRGVENHRAVRGGRGIAVLGTAAVLVLVALLASTASSLRAEFRTWSSASGAFSKTAEFVALKAGDVVELQVKDGGRIDVPLAKLSAADQDYVHQQVSGRPTRGAAAKPGKAEPPMDDATADKAVAQVEKEAKLCPTPEEALLLYSALVDNPRLPSKQRTQAQAKMADWQTAASKGLVRFGNKWVTLEEVRNSRLKSLMLINQGLEMVRLSNDQFGLERLLEASRVDPESIQADFIIATVYAIQANNYLKAREHYEICLKRDPTNVAVLNNLALVEVKTNEHSDAVKHWRQAAALAPDKRIAQNLGRLFDQAGRKQINLPPAVLKQLSDIYATLVLAKNVSAAEPGKGWQYMLIPQEAPPDEANVPVNPEAGVDSTTQVCGSGMVVAPGYVLTTRKGTKGADGFLIADPTQKGVMLAAKLIASSKDRDLALLKCEELKAPPLPIDAGFTRLGTDVVVGGYPEVDMTASHPKLASGKTVTLSVAEQIGVVAYECANNPTAGGGPVLDSMGNAVAMNWKTMAYLNNRYGVGIPMSRITFFLQEAVPGMELLARGQADMPQSQIEERLRASMVVVLAKTPAQDVGLAKRVGEGYLVDYTCCRCSGRKQVECPVRNCNRGAIPIMVSRSVPNGSGGSATESVRSSTKCTFCGGDGVVRCDTCQGTGFDPGAKLPKPLERKAISTGTAN